MLEMWAPIRVYHLSRRPTLSNFLTYYRTPKGLVKSELLIGLKPQSIDQCFTKQREDRIICSRVRFLAVLVLLFTRRKASPYR